MVRPAAASLAGLGTIAGKRRCPARRL